MNSLKDNAVGDKAGMAIVGILAWLLLSTGLFAAEITGTVSTVNGKTVVIDLDQSRIAPGLGDRVEISFKVGEKKFMVGDWRVIRVSGKTVYAEETAAKLPVDTGMQATIFTGTASQAAVQDRAAATANPPDRNSELFWRDPESQAATANQPPVQAARATDPSDELFWLRPGYRPGQDPGRTSAPVRTSTPQPQPQRQPLPPISSPAPAVGATGGAAIQSVITSDYDMLWNDAGSGAAVDFASFRSVGPAGYYPLGDVAVAGPWRGPRYGAPAFTTLLVRDGALALAAPVDYRPVWNSRGSNANLPFSSWEPVPPSGYQCLGDVASVSTDQKPSLDAIRCVPDSCVVQTGIGQKIWDDTGSGAARDFSAWRVPELNLYIGIASHSRPRSTVYTLSPSCL